MKIVRLYATADGESHVGELDVALAQSALVAAVRLPADAVL